MELFLLAGGLVLVWAITHKAPASPAPTAPAAPTSPPASPAPPSAAPVMATYPRGVPVVVPPISRSLPAQYLGPRATYPTIPGQNLTPPPLPTPPASSPSGPNATLLAECLRLTNAARATGQACTDGTGYNPPAPALAWNTTLARVAQAHSDWMAANNVLTHGDPGGDPGMRMRAAGYAWAHMAENVAAAAQTASVAVGGWLASHDGHCANVMSTKSTEIGIGVSRAADGTLYWTQDFGRPLGA